MDHRPDVVVVGAGIFGLCCALPLQEGGARPLILERADAVGGCVRSDRVSGFTLDRGFQVFLTAAPECQQVLDYETLDLQSLTSGALLRYRGGFERLVDPRRQPQFLGASLGGRIGNLSDRMRIARLRDELEWCSSFQAAGFRFHARIH